MKSQRLKKASLYATAVDSGNVVVNRCAEAAVSERAILAAATLLSLAVGVLLALACVAPMQQAHADDLSASFMVAAAQQDGTYVLEPTNVPYGEDDSVQDALEAADVGIAFTASGTIDSIAGVKPSVGMYLYSFTNYDGRDSVILSEVKASSIAALFISSADVDGIAQGHIDLLTCMRNYSLRSDGLRNYPDAKSAYERAYDSLPSAANAEAASIASDFSQAIEAYDAYMAGPKNAVVFSVSCAGAAVDDAQVAMVDLYGNVTQATRTGAGTYTANVVAGIYAYQVMAANGLDGVRGAEFVVGGNTQLEAELPSSEWFGSVTLRVKSDNNAACSTNGTSAANRATQTLQNLVPDAVLPEADLAVYAVPASAISSNKSSYPLYVVYTGVDGEDRVEQVAYTSTTYMPPYLVEPGTAGAQYTYEVRHYEDSSFLKYQVEICNASIERSPTLTGLSVREGTAELLTGFAPYTDTYDVYTSADEVVVAPAPRGSDDEGYAVRVNGLAASAASGVVVDVPESAHSTPLAVKVAVALGGYTKTYTVNVHKEDASSVTISHAAGIEIEVLNEAGASVAPQGVSATSSAYNLLAGHTYSYVATKDAYYHATCSFMATDGSTINAVTPPELDAVSSFALGRDNLWQSSASAKPLFEAVEGSTVHDQRFYVPDYWSSASWLRAYPTNEAIIAGTSYTYRSVHARQDTGVSVASSESAFKPTETSSGVRISGSLAGFTTQSGYSNVATFTVTTGIDTATGAVFTQDYLITAERILTLPALSVSDGDNTLKMAQADTFDSDAPVYGFERDIRDYVIAVAEGTESLQVRFTFPRPVSDKALGSGGYSVSIDGKETDYAEGKTCVQEVGLDPTQGEQTIPVIVRHDDPKTPDASYRLTVRLMPKVPVVFDVTPADASVTVTDPSTGLRISPAADGTFNLISGYDYDYTVAARGYVGQQGSFMAYDGLDTTVVLAAAPVNPTIDPGLTSHWPYFRADSDNNGVVDAKTPIPQSSSAADASDEPLLYWATQLGDGYDTGAAGCPILVDGYLYTYAKDKIYKLDTVSGEVVASGTMVGTSSFAITPMTYAEGMVFVALSNGRVEAFNAATLESLWVYTSPNGGQPNSPITYHDGCIYTGFWNWSNVCDFVCLTVTDEDPTTPGSSVVDDSSHPGSTISAVQDAKVALWTLQHEGGFYWAGAWAGDDYVLVGSDNAGISSGLDTDMENGATGPLFSIDPSSGAIIDTLTEYQGATYIGNIRSTIMRDASTGLFYFCGRGGYLCEVAVNDDGTFDDAAARAIRLKNNATDGMVSSTSTPVIYNGRAYVGADHGAYNAYDGQSIDVVDLATHSVAYTVNMQGRAQTSGLLTTGYLDEDGYVYIYYFDNYYPGKLRCFKDKPGQTHAIDASSEVYTQNGKQTTYNNMANVVFCPQGAQGQYCICSPIADEYGTIFFKNDSAYTMALGSPIEKLEVVEQPAVTAYGVGETFEPAGMKVVATYANGATRDVSDYVECSAETFEQEGVVDVPIVFPYTMYQSGADTQSVGTAPDYNYEKPSTTVRVTVGSAVAPRLTTTELPHAQAADALTGETPYEVQLTATGAPRDFTWTCEGTLPDGLTFDSQTATIAGTPAAGVGGSYPLKVTCENSAGASEADFVLDVYERPTVTGSSSVLQMETGKPFSYQVNATGYPEPLVYALQEGYVHPKQGWTSHTPAGLAIDSASGLISGTPLEPGDFHMRVYASNDAGISVPANLSVSVGGEPLIYPGAPEITNAVLGHALADAETGFVSVGEQVEISVDVTGTPEPTVSVEGLPAGLAFDAESGIISGAATAANEAGMTVTIRAENGQGPAVERAYTLYVYEAPSISTEALDGALYDEPYEQKLNVAGTPTPNVIVAGLASGLHYDKTEAKIYGTPKMKGTFKVSVTVTNTAGAVTKTYQLKVGAAPTIGVWSLPEAHEGEAYTAPLNVSGEPAPQVSVEGLPAGLAYDATNGVIGGTTSAVGSHEVRVTASNGVGDDAAKTFTLVVRESFELETAALPNAVAGQSYEATIQLSKPFASASVEGLPAGLQCASDSVAGTLTISGTPDSVTADMSCELTVKATSTGGTALNATVALVVETAEKPASLQESADLFPAEKGTPVSVNLADELQVTGRPSTFTWAVAEGSSLPAGFTLDAATGLLSGTPTQAGNYAFQVTCTNGKGALATALVKLQVNGAPVFGDLALSEGQVGKTYTGSVAVAEGAPAPTYSWEAADGSSLPDGLNLDSGTGIISGTPSVRGIFDVTVTAKSGLGETSAHVSIVVKQDIVDATIDEITGQTYTGAALQPVVKVYEPAAGASGGSVGSSGAGGSSSGGGSLQAGTIRQMLVEGSDYALEYSDNVNVGTANVVIIGKGLFTGSVVKQFDIAKAAQPLTVSPKNAKAKYKKLKKKAQKLAVGKAFVVSNAQGAVTCKLVKISTKKKLSKQAKKKIKLAKGGKITLKKGLKKGTYKLTVQVSAAGNANYNAGSKTLVTKVVVK